MRQTLLRSLLVLGLALGPASAPCVACPMCKAANETDQNGEPNTKPQAYMYSILFMLSMPATVLGAFGFTFWRMTRNAPPMNLEDGLGGE